MTRAPLFNPQPQGNNTLEQVYQDMERMPSLVRSFFRALTALPDPDAPIPPFDPIKAALRDLGVLSLFGATAGGAAFAAMHGIVPGLTVPLSIYASLGATGRLRRASVGHVHEIGHGVVTKHLVKKSMPRQKAARISGIIADLASALSLTTNAKDYATAHAEHHDNSLGTERDPDGADLKADGFWTGRFKSRRAFYGKLAATLLNPLWHGRKMGRRLHSNLLVGNPHRRALGALALMGVTGSALVMPLPVWLMAIGLPWTAFYHAASLLQVLTKHTYGHANDAWSRKEYADRCHERIPYRLMPAPKATRIATTWSWVAWSAGILLVDLPSRLAVLDSGMIGHAHHHMAWKVKMAFHDWTNTVPRMVEARRNGFASDAHAKVHLGLASAVRRQVEFMTSR